MDQCALMRQLTDGQFEQEMERRSIIQEGKGNAQNSEGWGDFIRVDLAQQQG